MSEHEHSPEIAPRKKPVQSQVAKEAHDSDLKADRPQGRKPQHTIGDGASVPHAGPDHHAHMAADFRKRFWISLILTLPVLFLSPMLQSLAGLREAIRFPGDVYVLFGFSSAIFWYGGWPFLKGVVGEIKSRRPGMMTLISVAVPPLRRCGFTPTSSCGSPACPRHIGR